jgi:hypothetical protein
MDEEEITRVDITNAAIQYPKWWKPWAEVIYIDTPKLLSFDIFERFDIRPWHIRILDNEELPYVGVICRIRMKRIIPFFKSMVELRKLILMCGYNDYDDFCAQFINEETASQAEVNVDD